MVIQGTFPSGQEVKVIKLNRQRISRYWDSFEFLNDMEILSEEFAFFTEWTLKYSTLSVMTDAAYISGTPVKDITKLAWIFDSLGRNIIL